MIRAVLADTGPLYAGMDPSDALHGRAQREIRQLEAAGWCVAVIYPVLLEAYTLVLRRLGLDAAHNWLQDVTSGSGLLNPVPEDYRAGIVLAQRFRDQPVTLVDTVTAAAGARLRMPVWTYDHHFELMRTAVWRPEGR